MKRLFLTIFLTLLSVGCGDDVSQPTDYEIAQMYNAAWEAMGWFDKTTMPIEWQNDELYHRVVHDTIGTFAELEAHLLSIFAADIVSRLLHDSRYRDIDGVLHARAADRGSNLFAGGEVHEIIRVSDYEIIYRVSVDIYGYDLVTLSEIEVSDFRLILWDGNWVFGNFHMVR